VSPFIFVICIWIQGKTGTGHTISKQGNTRAHMKPYRFLCKLDIKNVPTQNRNGPTVFLQFFNRPTNFHENPFTVSQVVICLQTERRTELISTVFFQTDANESVHETHVLFRMLFLFSLRLPVFEAIQMGIAHIDTKLWGYVSRTGEMIE
jgi:hypothetical protein